MTRRTPQRRILRASLLIAAEGKAEEAFVRHLASLYTRGGKGKAVSVRNAHGKGAGHVVNYAIRQKAHFNFDNHCAFFDGDLDWTDAVRARARRNSIVTVVSNPCIEALLLDVVGSYKVGSTAEQKRRFEDCFGGVAHADGLISVEFPLATLEKARSRVEALDVLIRLISLP